MSEDWSHQGIGGGFFDSDRPETGGDPSAAPMPPIPVFYTPSTYRGFSNAPSDSFSLVSDPSAMYSMPAAVASTQLNSFVPNGFSASQFRVAMPGMESTPSYGFRMDTSNLDNAEEDFEEATRKIKKRKLGGAPVKTEKPKRSILEEMLIILDESVHGIKWCLKVDTEGDIQDGMQIYNDTALEHTLEERRGVVGYGLSKHLAKDLRYYGFVYDRESKIFWNEDHKHPLTHRSYWQKDDRSRCLQLKRITSEAERNLSRLSSMMKNVPLAEILKVPEHSSICPPPSKYVILSEIHNIFPQCLPSDSNNIRILLSHYATNEVSRAQWEVGNVSTKSFDHLMTRLNTTVADFIADLREFVAGAIKWYHGVMERDEAVSLLHGQPEGTFLIRESTQSDCYSLSWVKFDPMQQALIVNHMRIEQTSAGFAVHGDDAPLRTIVQWIATHSVNLKNPLGSSRYSNLAVMQTSEKRYATTEGNLPANYMRGFPSKMETSSPSSPAQ